jgi:hypothetical protein
MLAKFYRRVLGERCEINLSCSSEMEQRMQAKSTNLVKLGIMVSIVSFLVATATFQVVQQGRQSNDISNALDASIDLGKR